MNASRAGSDTFPELRNPGSPRRALVIGGTGGIGRATAVAMARRGHSLVVHGGYSSERLSSTLRELAETGTGAEGFLTRMESPRDLDAELDRRGHFDIVVVAFGPFHRSSLVSTNASDWERIASLDLALPGSLVSRYLPEMLRRRWGRVLLFGGTGTDSIRAYTSNAAYAAAKTGLAVLAKSLALEGASAGVACILVCPGLVDTEYLCEDERRSLAARTPSGFLVEAAALADSAVGLLLAEPCIASGAILSLDAGIRL